MSGGAIEGRSDDRRPLPAGRSIVKTAARPASAAFRTPLAAKRRGGDGEPIAPIAMYANVRQTLSIPTTQDQFPRVYKLDRFVDDPRFEGFESEAFGDFLQTYPRQSKAKRWSVIRVAKHWTPRRMKGRVREFNDYPTIDWTVPAFSQRAVDALKDILERNGEILPVRTPGLRTKFYAYNVTTVVDAIDTKRTRAARHSDGRLMFIDRHEFIASALRRRTIFRDRAKPGDVYVTQPFVDRVVQAGLRGFNFEWVWPLPSESSQLELSKQQWSAHQSAGLSAGQTLEGQSVFINLRLADRKSPSADERRRARQLERSINHILVRPNDQRPAVGNIEEINDQYVAGVLRFVLTCPDAKALVEILRPTLRDFDWPAGFTVVRRNCHHGDVGVRGTTVKLAREPP